jgi:hypothetical protein
MRPIKFGVEGGGSIVAAQVAGAAIVSIEVPDPCELVEKVPRRAVTARTRPLSAGSWDGSTQ